MELQDIAFNVIYVKDLNGSLAFYRDRLGIPVAASGQDWVRLDTNGTALVLKRKTGGVGQNVCGHLVLRVRDLAADATELASRGVQFQSPPAPSEFGPHAILADPDDNEIELLEIPVAGDGRVTADSIVNDIIYQHPETMEVFEEHGIRICGGCLILLNAPVRETAEYSGLGDGESARLVDELNTVVNGSSADSKSAAK